MAHRPLGHAIARGALYLWVICSLWGCALRAGQPFPGTYPPTTPPHNGGQTGGARPPESRAPSPPPTASRVLPPRQQPSSPSMVASAQWVEEAVRAIDAGDYDSAATLLERAISLDPDNGRAFYYYGVAVGERGNPRNALTLLRKAEILLRGDGHALGDVYAQMGVNLERLGRRQEALQRYEQALAQDPEQALARRRVQALHGAER